MSNNNISNELINLTKKIKKEHFIKISLFIISATLILAFLLLTIFASIPFSNGGLKEGTGTAIVDSDGSEVVIRLEADVNALYVFNGNNGYIITWLSTIGLSGWICFTLYLSKVKNMMTPQFLKKVVRQSLLFGYLKQKDVDSVIKEVDKNLGLIQKEEIEEKKEEN